MKETDLFLPVKSLFESLGYLVRAEIKDIDVVATKEDEVIIIELKTSFTLKLIYQAIERQRITNHVYVAVPRLKTHRANSKSFKQKISLLRRLQLGFILVALDGKKPYAQIVFDPITSNNKNAISNKKRKLVLKELSERDSNANIGGTKGKIITAYRENALMVVIHLMDNEIMTVKELRTSTGNEKVQTLLSKNYYNWFERVGHGIYKLSDKGIQAYTDYIDVINQIK